MFNLIEKYKTVISISAATVIIVAANLSFRASAEEAKKKAEAMEPVVAQMAEVSEKVAKILETYSDRKTLLRNQLILHGIEDTMKLNSWTQYHIGVPLDNMGNMIDSVMFLDSDSIPNYGVLNMVERLPDSTQVIRKVRCLWRLKTK